MPPSSAATTSTTISVTWAPRARMEVNASCPGVSSMTRHRPLCSTSYAPMCWVIPPASWSITWLARIASKSDVFPWSTWPMIVTTGGRATRSSSRSASWSMRLSISGATFSTSKPYSWARRPAASASRSWFTVVGIPISISFLMTSPALTPIRWAGSPRETPAPILPPPLSSFLLGRFLLLPLLFLLFALLLGLRGGRGFHDPDLRLRLLLLLHRRSLQFLRNRGGLLRHIGGWRRGLRLVVQDLRRGGGRCGGVAPVGGRPAPAPPRS